MSVLYRAAVAAALLAIACQRQHPEDVPSASSSVGLVPAAPKALGARAATLEPLPLPEPEATPEPHADDEEAPPIELGDPNADGGVPL